MAPLVWIGLVVEEKFPMYPLQKPGASIKLPHQDLGQPEKRFLPFFGPGELNNLGPLQTQFRQIVGALLCLNEPMKVGQVRTTATMGRTSEWRSKESKADRACAPSKKQITPPVLSRLGGLQEGQGAAAQGAPRSRFQQPRVASSHSFVPQNGRGTGALQVSSDDKFRVSGWQFVWGKRPSGFGGSQILLTLGTGINGIEFRWRARVLKGWVLDPPPTPPQKGGRVLAGYAKGPFCCSELKKRSRRCPSFGVEARSCEWT